ncbi:short chain dehydrogenase domain-containing protein [Sarocladium implicatum]|nr:short chain dehydrogenase domain-containing protein [Sarocladium implicatum]
MAPLVWLITGCSSGLGQALTIEALSRGEAVIATARNVKALASLAERGAATLALDVTSNQTTLNMTIEDAIAIHGRIDVLVNNAGYVLAGALEETPVEAMRQQYEVNVFGPLKVATAVLPHFRERRSGINVFIGSLSGQVGHALTGPYASSKFALEGMVESLWNETKNFNIQTLLIEPGRFRTLLLSEDNRKDNKSSISDYAEATSKHFETLSAASQKQPGDVQQGVKIMVDLVRKEGVAEGKTVPFRFPLGTDCYEEVKEKLEDLMATMEEWREVITSTDHVE